MTGKILPGLFILMLLGLQSLSSQTTEVPVPLLYWGQREGDVRILVNSRSGTLQAVHKEVWDLMKFSAFTPKESLTRLTAGDFLTLEQWRTLGWDFVLNPETVTLALVLSPEVERPRQISLLKDAGGSDEDTLEGAGWSTVLNNSLEARWTGYSGIPDPGIFSLEGRMEFAGALKGGWSLEASAEADTQRTPFWSLEDVRLLRDFPREGVSLELGAIPARGQSWVQSPALWGFSFGTDFGLQPEKNIQSGGSHVLFLSEASTVIIRQNGQITGRLSVPAGPLELKDIPLRQGMNRVELEILSPGGRSESRTIELPFMNALLAPGILEYRTSLGLEKSYPENFRWDLQARRGFSETVTLGAGIQGDLDEVLLAAEASLATPVGSFRSDGGLGLVEMATPMKPTGALNLQYDWQHASDSSLPRVSVGLQWRSDGFRSPARNRILTPVQTLGVTGSLNQPLFGAAMGTLIGRSQWIPSASRWDHQLSGVLSIHPGDAGVFTLRATAERPDSGLWTWAASLNWSFFPDKTGFSSTLGQDLLGGSTLVQGSQIWEPDAFSQTVVSLGGSGNGFVRELRGGHAGVRYQSSLLEASLLHNSDAMPSGEGFQHGTRFRTALALAAADGLVAAGRPISGSFVLAEVLPEYRPYQPVLRSQTGGGASPMMPWGTGVLANLQAYVPHKLSPDSQSLPPGYHLGPETLLWRPERHQGARIVLGSPWIITLRSRLQDLQGAPVVLKAGTLRSEDGKQSQTFFTNRMGAFEISGLGPGVYNLTLVDGRSAKIEVGEPPSLIQDKDFIMVE